MRRFSILANLYQHRRYIWYSAWSELRYRYADTGMGVFWNIINPLIEIFIYTFIFSLLFSSRVQGGSYITYLCAGLLPWRVFSETITQGSNAFIQNTIYLKRLPIPAEVFVAKIALTSTFILYIYLAIFLPVNVLFDSKVSWLILLLPLLVLPLQILAFAISLVLANLRILLPDIQPILLAVLPLWSWTLPIVYPDTVFPGFVRPFLYLNPPYAFIMSTRNLILNHQFPELYLLLVMAFWLLFALTIGAFVNQKLRTEVKDAL
jgi:ABC-type polysaccharide/polyol phosphate export permease